MKKDATLEDWLDLGLFTRILCHEMNNLLASQQGFLKLLERGHQDQATLTRWNEEVVKSNQGLQDLVRSIQSFIHDESPSQEDRLDETQFENQMKELAEQALQEGAQISWLGLTRILIVISKQIQFYQSDKLKWVLTYTQGPLAHHLLEQANQIRSFLCIGTIFNQNAALHSELEAAANRILPPRNSALRDWHWALIIGLLRQSQGDLRLYETHPDEGVLRLKLEILIPLREGLDRGS
jgi:hypothetical protein